MLDDDTAILLTIRAWFTNGRVEQKMLNQRDFGDQLFDKLQKIVLFNEEKCVR